MSDVILDLKNEGLFINDELELTTNISFLYGKNGTGKSTLTSLFREQISDYDVRVFQGFEGVIGSNKKLNAVEYHRSSELDIAVDDLILLLGCCTSERYEYRTDRSAEKDN